MAHRVGPTPQISQPQGNAPEDVRSLGRAMFVDSIDIRARLRDVLPKDGEERMTAPLPLMIFTTAGLPAAADWEGSVVFDTTTNRLAYSDGSTWRQIANTIDMWERIATTVIAASTAQINYSLTQTYRALRVTAGALQYVTAGVGATVVLQLSADGGSTFFATSDVYDFVQGAGTGSGTNAGAFLNETGATVAASQHHHGVVDVTGTNVSGAGHFRAERVFENGAGVFQRRTAQGVYTVTGAVNYIRVNCTGSNINLGTITVEGLRV